MKKAFIAVMILFSLIFSLCSFSGTDHESETGLPADSAISGIVEEAPSVESAPSDASEGTDDALPTDAEQLSEDVSLSQPSEDTTDEPEGRRDWSGIPESFWMAMDGSLDYIQDYVDAHPNSFAFPVITDVHANFEWNEPNYLAWSKPDLFPVFLFLGDMTNGYIESQFEGAVDYMKGATGQKLIVSIGNHDFGGGNATDHPWVEGDKLPKEWWIPLLESDCVFCEGDNTLTYYWDDTENKVRYIMMDSNSTKLRANGVQRFDMSNLNWLASVLESSGDKDIIVLNHAMGTGCYLVTDAEKNAWKKDTGITNIEIFNSILLAYKDKTSISLEVDGVSQEHDFSEASGDLIGYITGHYHNAGHDDSAGLNKWTCNALTRNGGGKRQSYKGLSFFIIDKDLHKVIFLVVRYQNPEYEVYEYNY